MPSKHVQYKLWFYTMCVCVCLPTQERSLGMEMMYLKEFFCILLQKAKGTQKLTKNCTCVRSKVKLYVL